MDPNLKTRVLDIGTRRIPWYSMPILFPELNFQSSRLHREKNLVVQRCW